MKTTLTRKTASDAPRAGVGHRPRRHGTIKTTDCAPKPTKRRVFLIVAGVGASIVTMYGVVDDRSTRASDLAAMRPSGGAGTTGK